jgi:threonine/homoserine/homoserine lactone efflux protein
MMSLSITLAFLDNTDPGVAGWLVLAAWFVLFVFILNTIIFFLRRLFRRWRNKAGSRSVRHGEKQA